MYKKHSQATRNKLVVKSLGNMYKIIGSNFSSTDISKKETQSIYQHLVSSSDLVLILLKHNLEFRFCK